MLSGPFSVYKVISNAVALRAVPLNSPFEGGLRGMLFQWVTPPCAPPSRGEFEGFSP